MNRRLIDPFQSVELPERIEEYLDHGGAKCIAFNYRGTLLAAGCEDGSIVIWDFDTRGVARVFEGHSKAVTSVAWSRNGRILVSGALDGQVIQWNMEEGIKEHVVELEAAVVLISLDQRQPHSCLASFAVGPPLLIHFQDGRAPLPIVSLEGEGRQAKASSAGGLVSAVAVFGKGGGTIFMGQSSGTIAVLDTASLTFLDVIKVAGSPRVVGLVLNRKGGLLLANCSDRTIRMYEVDPHCTPATRRTYTAAEFKAAFGYTKVPRAGSLMAGEEGAALRLVRDFQNAVERMPWRTVAFSADSETVTGASATRDEHNLYLWSRVYGKLERILEGPKEGAAHLAWHPVRSVLASVSTTGQIYLWAKLYKENWSAFAPDFEELEENQEYVEREDEFDINPREDEGAAAHSSRGEEGVEGDVDILTTDPEEWRVFSSDDEEDERGLHYLPVHIEMQAAPEPHSEERQGGGSGEVDNATSSGSDSGHNGDLNGHAAGDEPESRRKVKLKVRFGDEYEADAGGGPGGKKRRK